MRMPRVNDIKAKRLRAALRAQGRPCHLCGKPIAYGAHHLDPASFQMDHLWQVANGGPEYDPDNVASAHRGCNRQRGVTIDTIAIAAAARYGVTLTPKPPIRKRPVPPSCAPAGQHCARCNGVHDPRPGISFETARCWW